MFEIRMNWGLTSGAIRGKLTVQAKITQAEGSKV